MYLLKTDIFCTKRCLATVSNNSATTPFFLLVITNGRQEVPARTRTSVGVRALPLGHFWRFAHDRCRHFRARPVSPTFKFVPSPLDLHTFTFNLSTENSLSDASIKARISE